MFNVKISHIGAVTDTRDVDKMLALKASAIKNTVTSDERSQLSQAFTQRKAASHEIKRELDQQRFETLHTTYTLQTIKKKNSTCACTSTSVIAVTVIAVSYFENAFHFIIGFFFH